LPNFDLASSPGPDGRLSLLVADRLTISVWLLSSAGGGGWARHAVIDAEGAVRSLAPNMLAACRCLPVRSARSSWTRRGIVLLQSFANIFYLVATGEEALIALDVVTEEMRRVNRKGNGLAYELDLESRLSAMKTF
jgi:hypothetical protein